MSTDRTCNQCKETKPLTAYSGRKRPNGKYYFDLCCKDCVRVRRAQYLQASPSCDDQLTAGDRRRMVADLNLWRVRLEFMARAGATRHSDGALSSTAEDIRGLIARYEALLAEDAQTRGMG